MPNHDRSSPMQGVPEQTPTDLPMPPYRFQRDCGLSVPDAHRSGTAQQAIDILRQADLLGCAAVSTRLI